MMISRARKVMGNDKILAKSYLVQNIEFCNHAQLERIDSAELLMCINTSTLICLPYVYLMCSSRVVIPKTLKWMPSEPVSQSESRIQLQKRVCESFLVFFRCVVFNNRGVSGEQLLVRRTFISVLLSNLSQNVVTLSFGTLLSASIYHQTYV